MAAITKIRIDGFKAFPEEFELALDGKNLLMYGENGSGKSSIYYALHALLQSQYHDKGFIYFDKNNPESLVNKYTTTADPYIEVELEGGVTKYHLSKDGYKELPAQAISPLRDMNAECVFINHKFLFNCFSFRNSQYIDLFPVFIKDILPFTFTNDRSKYISELYDKVVAAGHAEALQHLGFLLDHRQKAGAGRGVHQHRDQRLDPGGGVWVAQHHGVPADDALLFQPVDAAGNSRAGQIDLLGNVFDWHTCIFRQQLYNFVVEIIHELTPCFSFV